jgi:ferredoxin, 2Fe-2S
MFKLTILPNQEVIEVGGQESLLSLLKKNGYEMNSSCGGCASCGDCVIKIKEGENFLTEMTFEEKRLLGSVFHITKERLSCQTKLTGPVTIDLSAHPGKEIKKPKVEIRKKEEIAKVVEEKKDPQWFKHWEKKDDEQAPKKLGGNKRPKPFKFEDPNEK